MQLRHPVWPSGPKARTGGQSRTGPRAGAWSVLALATLGTVSAIGPARAAEPDRAPIVVALDAGHGGTNLGAAGPTAGVYEKNVTLALAERVRALLEAPASRAAPHDQDDEPRFRVVLCRTSDRLVTIRSRARCAEQSGARLFLSLHTNAVPAGMAPGSQHGYEVFVLGPREIEDDAALAALHASDDAGAAWQAHVVRAAGEQAIALARAVDDALARELGPGARRGVKQSGAALDVLRGTDTPAALVEVGFLDNPDEGARLTSASGREPIARALAAAIRAFTGVASSGSATEATVSRIPGSARYAAPSSRKHVQARLQAHAEATDVDAAGRSPRPR